MNLNLTWQLWKLWTSIKDIKTEALKNMGWKTITGAIIMGLGYAAKALSSLVPALDIVGDALIAIGVALGGIGVRAAISKQSTPDVGV
jgi:hypothetical protein